jgi:hypothetical protein
MAEITRETLELAALAAGYEVVCTEAEMLGCEDCSTVYTGLMLRGAQDPWRPHLDDGDAARLAVLIMMMTDCDGSGYCHAIYGDVKIISVVHDGTEPDKLRAWREAIVLCAAEIGRLIRDDALRAEITAALEGAK